MERPRRSDIDIALDEVLKVESQGGEIKQSTPGLKFDGKVDVAFWGSLAPSYESEYSRANYSVPL